MKKIEAMERKCDRRFRVVFEAINQLLDAGCKPKKKIGFEVQESAEAHLKRERTIKNF
jgi:hypothetical protein